MYSFHQARILIICLQKLHNFGELASFRFLWLNSLKYQSQPLQINLVPEKTKLVQNSYCIIFIRIITISLVQPEITHQTGLFLSKKTPDFDLLICESVKVFSEILMIWSTVTLKRCINKMSILSPGNILSEIDSQDSIRKISNFGEKFVANKLRFRATQDAKDVSY